MKFSLQKPQRYDLYFRAFYGTKTATEYARKYNNNKLWQKAYQIGRSLNVRR
jgi:hypothetical protein